MVSYKKSVRGNILAKNVHNTVFWMFQAETRDNRQFKGGTVL